MADLLTVALPHVTPDDARDDAAHSASRAGVRISTAHTLGEVQAASRLWAAVWGRTDEPPVSPELLRALTHAGNHLAIAHADGEVVGALLGFYGGDGRGPDHLHSHILGVDARMRGRGVGAALKLQQRAWALARGIDLITWTYDPLVRANGRFNVVNLGADGAAYEPDFYGAMADAINADDATDRVLVEWDLTRPRNRASAVRPLQDLAARALVARPTGEPVAGPSDGDRVVCATPADIVGLRRTDPPLARRWRLALREVLSDAFARGLRITAMTDEGAYVLTRTERARTAGSTLRPVD